MVLFHFRGSIPYHPKSSAYLIVFTFRLLAFVFPSFASRCFASSDSSPFNATFAKVGLIIPPCGVPAVVAIN